LAQKLVVNGDKTGTRNWLPTFPMQHFYEMQPALVTEFIADLPAVLISRNNRLVWGSMIFIAAVFDQRPEAVLPKKDCFWTQ
jgi:hypothetical protein